MSHQPPQKNRINVSFHFSPSKMLLPHSVEKSIKVITAVLSISSTSLLHDPSPSHASPLEQNLATPTSSISAPRLTACPPTSNCISSNYLEPPNRYTAPLKLVKDRDIAFQRAIQDIQTNPRFSLVQAMPKDYTLHLTIPGTSPNSIDDIYLLFPEEGSIVNVKCEAQVTLPTPPFCIQKGCINGNMDQRRRVIELSRVLGLPLNDEDIMKEEGAKWTPIFWNTDRVPDMVDYVD
jgi:uncharacterized protein (DUF1499 family)